MIKDCMNDRVKNFNEKNVFMGEIIESDIRYFDSGKRN